MGMLHWYTKEEYHKITPKINQSYISFYHTHGLSAKFYAQIEIIDGATKAK